MQDLTGERLNRRRGTFEPFLLLLFFFSQFFAPALHVVSPRGNTTGRPRPTTTTNKLSRTVSLHRYVELTTPNINYTHLFGLFYSLCVLPSTSTLYIVSISLRRQFVFVSKFLCDILSRKMPSHPPANTWDDKESVSRTMLYKKVLIQNHQPCAN